MTTTINGRTPEEIKRGLECCKSGELKCEECAFDGKPDIECGNRLHAASLAYIQQLERERDEARNDLDTINYANTELYSAYDAMKRERDAAIKDMAQTAVYLCCACKKYHHNDPGKDNHRCEMFEDSEGFERVIACDMFEWRGTQEEV